MKFKELQHELEVTRHQLNSWVDFKLFSKQPMCLKPREFTHCNMYEGMLIKALLEVGLPKHVINMLMKQTLIKDDLNIQPNIAIVFDRKILIFTDTTDLRIAIQEYKKKWNSIHIVQWRQGKMDT